jgi:hypothetical protein
MGLYCGIDLHSNNHVLTVIDEADRRVYERRLPNDLAITNHQRTGTSLRGEPWRNVIPLSGGGYRGLSGARMSRGPMPSLLGGRCVRT